MASDTENKMTSENQIQALREPLTQVIYQNQMMLGWVNGAVITVDKKGVILSANQMAQHSLGYTE